MKSVNTFEFNRKRRGEDIFRVKVLNLGLFFIINPSPTDMKNKDKKGSWKWG